jgi:hypothetical protein
MAKGREGRFCRKYSRREGLFSNKATKYCEPLEVKPAVPVMLIVVKITIKFHAFHCKKFFIDSF